MFRLNSNHLQAKLRTVIDYCKSKHVALILYSIIVVLTAIYSNKVNI